MPRPATRRPSLRATVRVVILTLGAVPIGMVSGFGSWALFEALDQATDIRLDHPWLVWTLPVAALVLGLVYHHLAGESRRGTALVIARSLPAATSDGRTTSEVPKRMAPLIFGATYVAQLSGASVGREGAALQIGASLTSLVTRPFRLGERDSRLLIVAAMAGAFGGAFGVPVAGAIFALEVRHSGFLRGEGLLPALAASIIADRMVEALGRSTPMIDVPVDLDIGLLVRLIAVGVAAGFAARAFITLCAAIRRLLATFVSWAPARPVLGAVATLGLMILVGRDYLGLSLPLVDHALGGDLADWWDPVLKIVFTAVALGSGIPGGEVTPLFVIGATLGSVLSAPLDLSPALVAAVTLAAVFGAAANTPIACAVLTVELFGGAMIVPAVIVCLTAYAVSPTRGIYELHSMGATPDLPASEGPRPRS